MSERLIKLSRVASHALRHVPEEYGLVLDAKGWVSINELLSALVRRSKKWSALEESDIYTMAAAGEKQRFEFSEGKIRAIYGHSFEQQVVHEPSKPPEILYHGTTPEAWPTIQVQGLKSMQRQYVHLSPDIETATIVAKRRTSNPVMLQVDAKHAHFDGKLFYRGNDKVWLSEFIEIKYLKDVG